MIVAFEGLGPAEEQKEGCATEILKPYPKHRALKIWLKRTPFQLGFRLNRHGLRIYLTRWMLGIGMAIVEIEWQR